MPTPEIEEFAKILVEHVRDASVQNCDRELQPDAQSPVAQRWRETKVTASVAGVLIPDCVDEAVCNVLQAIDQGLLHISFHSNNGKTVDLTEDGMGELAGWYMGSGGWRAMYSKERFVDDFADLAET
jgi:hypothetical protein